MTYYFSTVVGRRQCFGVGLKWSSGEWVQAHRHGHGLPERTRHRKSFERMDNVRQSDQRRVVYRHQGTYCDMRMHT